jgi:hypothetical protein
MRALPMFLKFDWVVEDLTAAGADVVVIPTMRACPMLL